MTLAQRKIEVNRLRQLKQKFLEVSEPITKQLLQHRDAGRKKLFVGYLKDVFYKPPHPWDAFFKKVLTRRRHSKTDEQTRRTQSEP